MTHTGAHIETAADLGYVYDNTPVPGPVLVAGGPPGVMPPPHAPSAPLVATPVPEPQVISLATTSHAAEKITLDGGSPSVQIPLQAAEAQSMMAIAHPGVPSAPGVKTPHLALHLEGIEFDQIPTANYQVYVNLPEGETPVPHGAYWVGVIPFFSVAKHTDGADAHAGHDHGGVKDGEWTLPLNSVVEKLLATGKWDATKLKFTFVQSTLRDAQGKPVAPKKIVPCKIARVSVVKIQ